MFWDRATWWGYEIMPLFFLYNEVGEKDAVCKKKKSAKVRETSVSFREGAESEKKEGIHTHASLSVRPGPAKRSTRHYHMLK